MKKLTLRELESVSGGSVSGFCAGFGVAAAAYQLGVWANIWNPIGQTAAIVAGVIGVGCALNELR